MMLKGTSWIHSDYGALFVDSPLIECCFEYFPFECHLLFSLVICFTHATAQNYCPDSIFLLSTCKEN